MAAKSIGERSSSGRSPKPASGAVKPVLEPEASAALRDQLVAELKALNSAEEAARLANLPNFALDRLSRYEAMLWRQGNDSA
jgi:hypothetical protein